MQVRIVVGASHAYVCMKEPNFSLDVRLDGGCSAHADLRRQAARIREDAARRIRRAERMEAAAAILESQEKS